MVPAHRHTVFSENHFFRSRGINEPTLTVTHNHNFNFISPAVHLRLLFVLIHRTETTKLLVHCENYKDCKI
jgi:hypothetical protein